MKKSQQDAEYLTGEGDNFFRRNFAGKDLPELRPAKTVIFGEIKAAGLRPGKVLEYGCNYGDLLAQLRKQGLAEECHGVEASGEAVAFGRSRYGNLISLAQGTIADNPLNAGGN